MRHTLLDGMRGYFLVFMMVNHLHFDGGALITRINHAELGYVQDAQGFVFLSGLIVGLHYTRMCEAGRGAEMAARLRSRAWELYRYAAAILVGITLLAFLLPQSEAYWGERLGGLYRDPAGHGLASLLLLFQPAFMDILPQYILYLAASPLLIRLVAAGRWPLVAAGSAALWASVQLGAHVPPAGALEAALQAVLPGTTLRSHFNPLAWQAVFVAGLLIGAAKARGRLDPARLFPADRAYPALALAVVLFFAACRLGFAYGVVPEEMDRRFWS